MRKDSKHHLHSVIEYYDKTRFDYRVSWDNSEHPAVHFGFYDDQVDKHSDALQNTNRHLAELAGIQAGEHILDAGCGKGGSCFWLARNLGARATGITPVQSQISDCKTGVEKLNLSDKVDFVLADYCNMPFDDESFDVVWACESLCHAGDKSLFYREAYRVLKPGGRLVIAEYLRSERPLAPEGEELLHSWLDTWAIPDIDTQAEHEHNAGSAGFSSFKVRDVTDKTRTSLRNLHRNASNWTWFSKLLQLLFIRTKVQHRNMVGSIRQYEALEKGFWFYSVMLGQK
jgi:ubiquinone/menaquinone biosynthesis C-methylase UbiE